MSLPAIFLDVDGVVSPLVSMYDDVEDLAWSDYRMHHLGAYQGTVCISRNMAAAIMDLNMDIVWVTDWEEHVDSFIAPLAGFQQGYERIPFSSTGWQADAVLSSLKENPRDFAWCFSLPVTDADEKEIIEFAEEHDLRWFLLEINDEIGILPQDIVDIYDHFYGEVTGEEEEVEEPTQGTLNV